MDRRVDWRHRRCFGGLLWWPCDRGLNRDLEAKRLQRPSGGKERVFSDNLGTNRAASTCAPPAGYHVLHWPGTRTDPAAPARSPSGQPPHPRLRQRGGHETWRGDAEDWISATNDTVVQAATVTVTVTATATSLAVAATTVAAALLFPTTLSSTTLTAAAVSSEFRVYSSQDKNRQNQLGYPPTTPGGERYRPDNEA